MEEHSTLRLPGDRDELLRSLLRTPRSVVCEQVIAARDIGFISPHWGATELLLAMRQMFFRTRPSEVSETDCAFAYWSKVISPMLHEMGIE